MNRRLHLAPALAALALFALAACQGVPAPAAVPPPTAAAQQATAAPQGSTVTSPSSTRT